MFVLFVNLRNIIRYNEQTKYLDVHHKVKTPQGVSEDIDDLVTVCDSCHKGEDNRITWLSRTFGFNCCCACCGKFGLCCWHNMLVVDTIMKEDKSTIVSARGYA